MRRWRPEITSMKLVIISSVRLMDSEVEQYSHSDRLPTTSQPASSWWWVVEWVASHFATTMLHSEPPPSWERVIYGMRSYRREAAAPVTFGQSGTWTTLMCGNAVAPNQWVLAQTGKPLRSKFVIMKWLFGIWGGYWIPDSQNRIRGGREF